MSELQKLLDEAAKELAKLNEVEQGQWLAYFLEAVESECGKEGLEKITFIANERERVGGW